MVQFAYVEVLGLYDVGYEEIECQFARGMLECVRILYCQL